MESRPSIVAVVWYGLSKGIVYFSVDCRILEFSVSQDIVGPLDRSSTQYATYRVVSGRCCDLLSIRCSVRSLKTFANRICSYGIDHCKILHSGISGMSVLMGILPTLAGKLSCTTSETLFSKP